MKSIKIQSVSDIITNSSSEVFMIVDENDIKRLYNIIDDLLKAMGKDGVKATDIFDITPDYNEKAIDNYILNGYKDPEGEYYDDYDDEDDDEDEETNKNKEDNKVTIKKEDITDEMRLSAVYRLADERSDYGYNPPYNGVSINVKDAKYGDLANCIYKIIYNFDHVVRDC